MRGDGSAIVYQATNLIDGKRYIGITTQSLAGRRSAHKIRAIRGDRPTHFASAIRRDGIENFRFVILQRCADRMEAVREEIRLIAALKPEYNMTPGGDGCEAPRPEQLASFYAGRSRASEKRRKPVICLSDGRVFASGKDAAQHYGFLRSALTLALKGRNATVNGLLFTYYTGKETRLEDPGAALVALREEQRRKFLKHALRPVWCLNDGKFYPSSKAAAEAYGITRSNLCRMLKGNKSHAGGYRFAYAKEARQ